MLGSYFLGYFLPVIISVLILVWIRTSCDTESNFPTRGHAIILSLTSLIPILNWIEAAILIGIYISGRVSGNITLKDNEFNKFFFDKKSKNNGAAE